MQTVKVSRNELLKSITTNRATHHTEYVEAEAGYRDAAIKQMAQNLKDAQDGKDIQRHLQLPQPDDHTEDYDREIKMLQMSVDDVIELTVHDFDRYVMDNWEWKQAVTATNMFYKARLA